MRNLSALVIASFIVAAPTAQAEDGAERYSHILDRICDTLPLPIVDINTS